MGVLDHELAIVALGIGLLSLSMGIWAQVNAHLKLGRKPARTLFCPPISILKPLSGLDDALYENLASVARQRYPQFELLFGVREWSDDAVRVVRKLQRDFPDVPMRLVAQPSTLALNPKVNTLLRLLPLARFNHILISDSNVAVDADYLTMLSAEMADPTVAMVSSLIAGEGEETIGAALENLHLCSFVSAMACTADRVGNPLVIGKSMLMRRAALEEVGGLWSVRDVLAEDYVLGQRFFASGHRVVLSPHIIDTVNRTWTVRRFLSRHLRWAQLRRWGSFAHFVAEPLAYPIPLLLLSASIACSAQLSWNATRVALAGVLLKMAGDAALAFRMRRKAPPVLALVLTPLKDCVLLAVWAVAALRRTVDWRGHRLRIGPGTLVQRISSHPELAGSSPEAV